MPTDSKTGDVTTADSTVAFLNGERVDAGSLAVSAFDTGFMMGVSVTEQIRTFGRSAVLLERHLDRLFGGLEQVGIQSPFSRKDFREMVEALVARNGRLLPPEHELGIGICVTPGVRPDFGTGGPTPTTIVYSYGLVADKQRVASEVGFRLRTVGVREIPDACLPKSLKCRSRMHYWLADREATEIEPGSRALLLHVDGTVAEATTASVIFAKDGVLIVPPQDQILASVTLAVTLELAGQLGIGVQRRAFGLPELAAADEILWLSTPVGIAPVTHLDGAVVGDFPGPVTLELRKAWGAMVGLQYGSTDPTDHA